MKNDHLSEIGLVLGVHTGGIKIKGKSEEKREAKGSIQGRKFCSPSPSQASDSHAISSPFQVFIMSMKCPRSNPK